MREVLVHWGMCVRRMLTAAAVTGTFVAALLHVGAATASDEIEAVAASPLRGLVITADDLPYDAQGVPTTTGLPVGRAPQRELTASDLEAFDRLKAERDRVTESSRDVRRLHLIQERMTDATAPARMDSGDPDPDRLMSRDWGQR